jgi:mycothiol synthase
MVMDERELPGLYMLWPGHLLTLPPGAELPKEYTARPYAQGDDDALKSLLAAENWGLNDEQWKGYKDRLLPNGLFVISHTDSNTLVATAGAVHNPSPGRYYFPFGGELALLIVDPEHRGQGLGQTVSALVVQRFLSAGYECIRVGVQGFRLAAVKTYLKLGFVPFLHHEDLPSRWKRICDQIGWPYIPDEWPRTLSDNLNSKTSA